MLLITTLWIQQVPKYDDPAKSPACRTRRARTAMSYAVMGILFSSNVLAEVDNHLSPKCYEDAMLVFDASGSMSGIDAYSPGSIATRIDDARKALAKSLPRVTPYRRLGLMTYGPGGTATLY